MMIERGNLQRMRMNLMKIRMSLMRMSLMKMSLMKMKMSLMKMRMDRADVHEVRGENSSWRANGSVIRRPAPHMDIHHQCYYWLVLPTVIYSSLTE